MVWFRNWSGQTDMLYAGADDGGEFSVSNDVEEHWARIEKDFLDAAKLREGFLKSAKKEGQAVSRPPAWYKTFRQAGENLTQDSDSLISDEAKFGESSTDIEK